MLRVDGDEVARAQLADRVEDGGGAPLRRGRATDRPSYVFGESSVAFTGSTSPTSDQAFVS
jgi:hypothetical protein